MASTDSRPVPRKNTAFRYYFAVRKSDGTLITTWAGQDSEVSLDGAAFGDCTNEATEIGTSGYGYLDLTSSEMNADAVGLKITVTNTGALPVVVTFFPEESGDYRVDAANSAVGSVSGAVGSVTGAVGSVTGNVGGNVTGSVGSVATGGITAASFASGALDAVWSVGTRTLTSFGSLVSDVATAVWAAGTRTLTAFGFTPSLHPDYDAAKTAAQAGDAMALVNDAITAAKIAADAIGASELAADASAEIAAAVRSELATELARIDATISSRLASAGYTAPPSAATNASAVRTELTTELGRIDASVSSRASQSSVDDLPTNAELATALAAADDAVLAAIAALSIPTANNNADALLDRSAAIEAGLTFREAMRLIVAAEAGKLSGAATTTVTIRDIADTKNRIVATVDADGNRTALTRDLT